jgi:hypothetical protein
MAIAHVEVRQQPVPVTLPKIAFAATADDEIERKEAAERSPRYAS